MLEHDDVYTCGSGTQPEHLKAVKEDSYVVDADRAGSITFHGAGQLVGYPIVTVGQTRGDMRSSLTFIRQLQDILIEALDILGVAAIAKHDYTGVWFDKGSHLGEYERFVKICAIGVKVAQGRTRHGFALNISTELSKFDRIIPCGIEEYAVSSLHELGYDHISIDDVRETITKVFLERFGYDEVDIASTEIFVKEHKVVMPVEDEGEEATGLLSSEQLSDSILSQSHVSLSSQGETSGLSSSEHLQQARRPQTPSGPSLVTDAKREQVENQEALRKAHPLASIYPPKDALDISRFSKEALSPVQPSLRMLGRLSKAGVKVDLDRDRRDRPKWMKNRAKETQGYQELKGLTRGLKLHTVCEEAGCPNIYECWGSKTATFMILGERCTRACSFCLVDTRKPFLPDPHEPRNVARAVKELGLEFAVITCVTRDDLEDGGAGQFAQTVQQIRLLSPGTGIELLISDCQGKSSSLEIIFKEKPDILNHNIETVARLQRAVRPSAGYARSLSVLARAKQAGLKTKSGIIVGMGEATSEILQTLRDLRNVGVEIVTIGQYLQPTPHHLPVDRFVEPAEFAMYKEYGEKLGISHVESGPLVRSSYHAKNLAESVHII